MIIYLCSVAFAFIAGAVGGILVYRKNGERLKATEDKGKALLDALKGK